MIVLFILDFKLKVNQNYFFVNFYTLYLVMYIVYNQFKQEAK